MKRFTGVLAVAAWLPALLAMTGCATGGAMTAQQREGVELRRFCEQHPEEVEKCLGFLGWR